MSFPSTRRIGQLPAAAAITRLSGLEIADNVGGWTEIERESVLRTPAAEMLEPVSPQMSRIVRPFGSRSRKKPPVARRVPAQRPKPLRRH
jgi:hypothetical protein